MSSKARRDEAKHYARLELAIGTRPEDLKHYAVSYQAGKLAARNKRLALVRESKRQSRYERSIKRRAEARQAELTAR
jgi:hypothetical protein